MKRSLLVVLLCALAGCNSASTAQTKDGCGCCSDCSYETFQKEGDCGCCDSCCYKR